MLLEHVQLYRRTQANWQSYDAYARVCMAMGTNQYLDTLAMGLANSGRDCGLGQSSESSLHADFAPRDFDTGNLPRLPHKYQSGPQLPHCKGDFSQWGEVGAAAPILSMSQPLAPRTCFDSASFRDGPQFKNPSFQLQITSFMAIPSSSVILGRDARAEIALASAAGTKKFPTSARRV